MAKANDDPRIYQALALPEQALGHGGLEILRLGLIDDELYVSALPAFKAPALWGEVLAEVANRLGTIYGAQKSGLSRKDATVQIVEAFAAEMGARPVKTKKPAKKVAKKVAQKVSQEEALMPINILMPALSPTMEKGNLAKWLKKEGDTVKSGDIIAEIETDKATMEVEAVDEGTIAKIVVPEGTADVPVNQVIAVLAGEGEDVKSAAAGAGKAAPAPAPKPAAPQKAAAAEAPAPRIQSPSPLPGGERSPPKAAGEGAASSTNRIFASPLAKRLAKEAGIDLTRIQGSGPHGRVIQRDVEGAKSGKGLKAAPGAPAAATAPSIAPSMSDAQVRALFEDGSYEVVPHDGMRRTIAQRLTQSMQTIPHFYLTMDCNIGKLLDAREEINAAAPKGQDGKPAYKLSVNDFVIKALALALQRIPNANVSWTEAGMLKHKHSDVGVAVAMPGGLITPIIRQAETKSLSTISNEMKDFAARARSRKLKPNEYQGGTTAVSNLGMYGIKDFTAVINPPHATILAVGAGEERAIVKSGKIEAAHIMSVTLSCDHRAVDGALGAELIGAFKKLIENPVMMVV